MLEANPAAGRSGAFVYAGFGSALRKTGGTTASRNLASEARFRAALEGFAGPDAKVVVEDYPRETHGTIAVPVFHEAMKRLRIKSPHPYPIFSRSVPGGPLRVVSSETKSR